MVRWISRGMVRWHWSDGTMASTVVPIVAHNNNYADVHVFFFFSEEGTQLGYADLFLGYATRVRTNDGKSHSHLDSAITISSRKISC